MTDIEQRLRRTFQVVADQPIPWPSDAARPRSRRNVRALAGGLAVVVVIALVVLGVDYGPRSSPATPARGSVQPGLGTSTGGLRAVFAPGRPSSRAVLDEVAATMVARLHALGDYDTPVYVEGGTIVVRGPRFNRSEAKLVANAGVFFIRPVLCGAASYRRPAPTTSSASASPLVCDAPYVTTASNLDVNTATGQPLNRIGPDPNLASYPSTTEQNDDPTSTVLLPAFGAQQFPRFVLGPAQLSGSTIAAARAQYSPAEATWFVDVTLKPSAAAQWDTVPQQSFHAYIAADLDGEVLWAPLIQPQASTFTSFHGQMQIQIAENFTATEARGLAALLGSGPLPVQLVRQSESFVSPSLG